jgi:hypothetical protein
LVTGEGWGGERRLGGLHTAPQECPPRIRELTIWRLANRERERYQ